MPLPLGGPLCATSRCESTPTTGARRSSQRSDWADLARKPPSTLQGVRLRPRRRNVDALLCDPARSPRRDFSPTTMYRDFAISPTCSTGSRRTPRRRRRPTGQRYIHHASAAPTCCSSCREHADRRPRGGAPFLCLGECDLRRARAVSGPSRSPGGCGGRCLRRRSSRRGSSRPERCAQRDTSPACAAGGWSEQWSSRFHLVCRSGALPARFCAGWPSPLVPARCALPADPTAQGAGRPPTGRPGGARGGPGSPFRGPTVTATPKTHPRSDDADG